MKLHIGRWFNGRSKYTKAGLLLAATFIIFGGLGVAMRPAQHSAAVQGAQTLKSTGAESVDVSEKSRIAVTKTEIETTEEEVPFSTTQTYDGTLPKDTTIVKVEGRNGKKLVRTEIKTRDGEVSRSLISETVTVPAVTKVVAIGTKILPKTSDDKPKKCQSVETTAMCTSVDDTPDPCTSTTAAVSCTDENEDH